MLIRENKYDPVWSGRPINRNPGIYGEFLPSMMTYGMDGEVLNQLSDGIRNSLLEFINQRNNL